MPPRQSRIGLLLFVIYMALYAGFVGINAFSPALMKWTPLAGVNLAVLYGFGLIIAFVFAQAAWLSKYLQDEPAKADSPKP